MKTLTAVLLSALALLSPLVLSACNRPTGSGAQDSKVGAAMPDTTVKPANDPLRTAPDAGATGAVPTDGSAPPMKASPRT